MDRFLAIKFCLSYHAIVTVKIIVMVISFCWIFSIATIPLLWINGTSGDIYTDRSLVSHQRPCDAWINFNFSFNLYKSCKKKTLNQSSREKNYFGVSKEKLDMLKRFKKNLKDIFKFNIATPCLPFILTLNSFDHILQ